MKERYQKCIWMLLLLSLSLLTGCGERPNVSDTAQEEPKEAVQIGITFDSFIIERWQRDRDLFVSAARELGAEVNVQNANGDMKEQIAQIDYFIQKGMDAIVVVMVASDEDESGLVEAVGRAQRAGIPVVAYDRLILNAGVDLYISFDNGRVGELMGEHMREHLSGEGELLQVCGPMADYNVPQVMDGFQEALLGSDLKVRKTEYAEGWLGETGFTAASDYLKTYGEVDGIMCGNDNIAGNAVRALSERRMAGRVCVVGQDADLDACQRIVEGTQCMTVYKPVEKLARRAAELSVALARGERIRLVDSGGAGLRFYWSRTGESVCRVEAWKSIWDGTYKVPYERLDPVAVTKENMDEIITGKYHEEGDIYLNIRK